MASLLIIGAGGHGRSVADAALATGRWDEIAFADDGVSENARVLGLRVVGASTRLAELRDRFDEAFVAIGDNNIRLRWLTRLAEHSYPEAPVIVHPTAYVSPFAQIGAGTCVLAGAVVGPGAAVGRGCIVNTCASVDHDCTVGDGVHLSPGAHLAGTVKVGRLSWICIGASVSNGVTVGENCVLAAGAALVKDMEDNALYAGVPAALKKKL